MGAADSGGDQEAPRPDHRAEEIRRHLDAVDDVRAILRRQPSYDFQGNPIGCVEWVLLKENHSRVAYGQRGDVEISTIYMGTDGVQPFRLAVDL